MEEARRWWGLEWREFKVEGGLEAKGVLGVVDLGVVG